MDKFKPENFEPKSEEQEKQLPVAKSSERKTESKIKGNEKIGQELMQYYPRIRSFVNSRLKYIVPTAEIDDITQRIIFKAWRGHSSFRGETSLLGWIFIIARNEIKDTVKKAEKDDIWKGMPPLPNELKIESEFGEGHYKTELKQLAFEEGRPDVSQNIEGNFVNEEKRKQILDLLSGLSHKKQRIFELFYFEDMPQEQIAANLKITPLAVKMALNYTKNHIKKQFPNKMKNVLKQK